MGRYNSRYGYGIRIDDITNFKEDAFLKLVKEKNLYDDLDLDEEFATDLDCKDAIEDYQNSMGEMGIGAILSNLAFDDGIELTAITDCNGCQYLVIMQDYPWNFSDEVRKMTSEDVDRYFKLILYDLTDDIIDIKTWEIEESYG